MDNLTDPHAFDELLYSDAPVLPLGVGSELEQVRAAQAAFVRGDVTEMEAALKSLEGVQAPPAQGVTLMLRVMLGGAEDVARLRAEARGSTPLHWEETCHSAAAIAVACSMVGRLECAEAHLLMASTLAQGLGLRHRAQMLTLELARVRCLRGRPTPSAIQEQLSQNMPARRQAWGRRTLAESLMSLGVYGEALQMLGVPPADSPPDAALRDFLHAIQGLPAVPEVNPELPYARLAAAWRDLGKKPHDLYDIQGQPEEEYAVIIEALSLLSRPGMSQQTVRLLSRRQMSQPALVLIRLLLMFAAVADGAKIHPGMMTERTTLSDQVLVAAGGLRQVDEIVRICRRLLPEKFTILAFGPFGSRFSVRGLPTLTLIAGKSVMTQQGRVALPSSTGQALVLDALGLPFDEPSRFERKRCRDALAAIPGPHVNLGGVARGCLRLSANAARLGHADEAAGWRHAYAQVVKLLDGDVQDVMAEFPPVP